MAERKLTVYVWWALNFFLVLFAFLAMVLSGASLHKSAVVEKSFTSNNMNQAWNMVLSSSYKVAPGFTVNEGQMVSFVGIDNNGSPQIAPGLGPMWGKNPLLIEGQWTASSADISPLSPSASIYAYVSTNFPDVLQLALISTPAQGGVYMMAYTNVTLPTVVRFVKVKSINPTNFALLYSTGTGVNDFRVDNLVAGYVNTGYTSITVAPSAIVINNDPTYAVAELSTITSEANPNNAWVQVVHGVVGSPCIFDIYQFNTQALGFLQNLQVTQTSYSLTCNWPLASKYIQGGYFVVSNGNNIVLAQANWGANTITGLNVATLPRIYGTLEISVINPTQLVLSGVQMPGIEAPQPMVEVVSIANNVLVPSPAINLFPSFIANIYRGHLRACAYQNYLLFTYVDSFFGIASLIRGEIISNSFGSFVLPSTRIAISTANYTENFFGETSYGPLLVCPTAASSALLVYQSFPPAMNTFTWGGGFKLAGIAQSTGSAGQSVNVVKSGISYAHSNLETGYGYFVSNYGNLYPITSATETFTPNGIPVRIGDALSESNLVLAMNILDLVNNIYV